MNRTASIRSVLKNSIALPIISDTRHPKRAPHTRVSRLKSIKLSYINLLLFSPMTISLQVLTVIHVLLVCLCSPSSKNVQKYRVLLLLLLLLQLYLEKKWSPSLNLQSSRYSLYPPTAKETCPPIVRVRTSEHTLAFAARPALTVSPTRAILTSNSSHKLSGVYLPK